MTKENGQEKTRQNFQLKKYLKVRVMHVSPGNEPKGADKWSILNSETESSGPGPAKDQ